MNDFTWYSRLFVWVGGLVLLVQSVTGRSLGILSALAVLAMAFGLLGLLGGLVFEHRGFSLAASTVAPSETAPPVDSGTPAPAKRQAPSPEPPAVARQPVPVPAPTPVGTPDGPAAARAQTPGGAISTDVVAGDSLEGVACISCHEPLRVQQVAATCQQCGAIHHATCWINNHFHCARDGCSGRGNLRAPSEEEVLDTS
ncbi:MAG: hypothetical protein ACRDFX_01860 [Chloroflexota bacterium]